MNELTLQQQAERHKIIKRAAESVKRKRAENLLKRRRDAEYQRDLKRIGVN